MSLRLSNKVALVTGGGSGIGKAICLRFAEQGANVLVTDINFESATLVADEIINAGGKAEPFRQDVTQPEQWNETIKKVLASYGTLDILVNNAGIALPGNIENTSNDDWFKTQAVNSDSVFFGMQATIAVMKSTGGSIINISSIEGIIGEANTAAYNASKGAVRILTKSAALHCASENYDIRINSVHPGFVLTPMVENALKQLSEDEGQQMMMKIMADIPLKRLGTTAEIANACLFLASDESSYITGSELIIDGGYTAR